MQSNEQAKKIAIDYIDELCYYEKTIPDSLYRSLNYFVDGIGVQRADCMVFFPNEEDESWEKGKAYEVVGFGSEFFDEIYYISYQEFYDLLHVNVEKAIVDRDDEYKTTVRELMEKFRKKHNLK